MSPGPTIIIGGGLAGVSTLLELSLRSVEAVLVEAREDVALETSFANGAMLTASMPDPWNNPGVGRHLFESIFDSTSAMKLHLRAVPDLMTWGLQFLRNSTPSRHKMATAQNFRLACYSLLRMDALRAEFSLNYDAAACGVLKVFESREAMDYSIALAELLTTIGLQYERLDAKGTVNAEPLLDAARFKIVGALRFPDDKVGDAHLFTRAIADLARRLGATILTGVTVQSIVQNGSEVAGVETDRGFMTAKKIVVAAGNATPAIVRPVGIKLPIKPVKGYSLTYDSPAGATLPSMPVIDDARHAAVVPFGERLRAVGVAEFAGYDVSIRQQRIEILRSLFARLYPDIAARIDESSARPWTGLRPMSADGKPFIGKTKIKGVWVNAGHGHLGWTMAAGSAALLADMMTGARPAIDPAPYVTAR